MAFNPDEYLKQDESTFDPDAYLKLESPSRPEQIRLGAPAKKTEPKPETKPLPRAEKPAGQAGSRKAPEPPMSEGARPLTHEEQVAMTHWAFKNREQAQGLVSLDHVPSRKEAKALGLPAGSKEDRAAAWNGAREMATATQPEIPKPDLPTEAKYGPELETGVMANLPASLREFISEDTYATEQAHYFLASTADVIPGLARGAAHTGVAALQIADLAGQLMAGKMPSTKEASERTLESIALLNKAADSKWLTWTRDEKEWAAEALAQKSWEDAGWAGRMSTEGVKTVYDTVQQLALLKSVGLKYGGGDGVKGRLARAVQIAAFRTAFTESNPESDIPIWEQKLDAFIITTGYMGTTAFSGLFGQFAVPIDMLMNTAWSATKAEAYKDAAERAEARADRLGLSSRDREIEGWVQAANVFGMDAVFALQTKAFGNDVGLSRGQSAARNAKRDAIQWQYQDLQDRRGPMVERYAEAQKTGDKAEMDRAAEDMQYIDAAIKDVITARQNLEASESTAPIKQKGESPVRIVTGAQDEEERKPLPWDPEDRAQVAKENPEMLTPEGRAEQEAWAARQVEAQNVVEAPKVKSKGLKRVEPVVEKVVEAEKPVEAPKVEVEVPKVEAKPVEVEKPVEATPKPEEPPPVPKTTPKPVEVKVVSGEGSGRVLKSNFDDIPEDRRATAVTPQEGVRIAGEFRVLDADKLITSEDKGYDQVIQERNRKTAGSREQIEKIAKEGPDFTRLHRNPESDGGAPWVDDLGQVISGNGRVLGIRQAYERGTAADYEKQVRAMAEKMGVDLTGVKRPVLIGEIKDTGGASVLRVAELSNKPAILQMTPAERAKAESKIVNDPDMIRLMDIPKSGDLASASNRKFVMEFIRRTGDDSMRKSDGTPDPSAISRIKQAILASVLATDDAGRDLVRLAIERQTELGVADHITAIVASGSRLSELGRDRPDLDIRPALASGFKRFLEFKNQRLLGKSTNVEDFIGQKDFLDPISAADALIVKELAKAKSAKQFRSFLDDYVDAAKKVEGANEGMLFGRTEAVTPETLLSKVTEKTGVNDERAGNSGRSQEAEIQQKSPDVNATGGRRVPETKPAPAPKVEGEKVKKTGKTTAKPKSASKSKGEKPKTDGGLVSLGFKQSASMANDYAMTRTSEDGKTKEQFNVRVKADGSFVLRRSVSFPGTSVTGAPTQTIGTFKSVADVSAAIPAMKPAPLDSLLEGTESVRPKVAGETKKPQVAPEEMLGGLRQSMAAGKAERAQAKMDLGEKQKSVHESAWERMSTQERSIVLSRLGVDGPRSWASKSWPDLTDDAKSGISKAMNPRELGERPRVDVKTPLSNLSAEKQAKAAQLIKEIAAIKVRMGMGVGPEYLTKGTQLAALYIEGGVKTFEQFATNIKADFGDGWDNIKEYLHAIWSGAGVDARDIDDITRSHAENIIARIDRGEDAPPPPKVAVEGQGISHAQIDKLREVWDMATRADRNRPTDKDMGEIVRDEYAKDADVGQKLVNSILGTDRPKVDSIDYAVMVAERVRVEDLLTRAIRDGNEKQASEYTKRLSDIADAADKSGSESGATLRARQFLKGDDFGDVYVMKRNLEKSQGDKPATPGQVAALTAMKRSYDEAVKERDEARERVRSMQQEVDAAVADRAAATEYRQLVDDAMKRAAAPAKVEGSPAFVSAVRKTAAFLEQDADARIRKLMASTSSVERAIPEAVLAIAEYGAGKLLNSVANWTDLAVKTYGDWVKPHLAQASIQAENIRDEVLADRERVAGEKRKGKKAKPATADQLIGEADTLPKKLRAVYRNIADMDIAEKGEARGFEDATVAVKEFMKDVFGMDLTDSEIRVQFSDYGKTRSNVRTEVDLAVTHYRREAQLTESLERLLQGQRVMQEKGLKEFPPEYLPKKSGLVRPKASDSERDAQKEIHRLMKELKIKTVNPAQQLATWEAATKTRLENSIHDLRMAIESGKPKAGGEKTPNVYTDELMRLSTIEKELREAYKEMFPPSKTPLTKEQRADIAMKAAQRSLQNWEVILNNAKKGDFSKKEKPGAYTNDQIDGVRQARDAIREEVKRLKDLATPKRTPEEIAVAAKKKRNENILKELNRRIAEKDFSVKDRRHVSLAGDAEGLAAERKIAEARRELAVLKEDARKSQRTMAQIIGEKTLDAVDFVRYVKSTWDMSGLLRQGGPVAVSDFDVWRKALVPVAKAWWSKENSQKDWEQFQTRRNFALYEQAKLGISHGDGMGGFGRIDDIRKSMVADKIPIVERSQRSFATTLNHLRADLFDKLLAGSEDSKDVSKEKIQDIARFVNTWTGRGDIGGRLDARTLGAVFWAPKFVKSSLDIATTKAIWDGKSTEVKKMAAIRYAKALTTLAALYGSYAAIQALNKEEFDVELNPTSSLFGSIKVGNYYVNPIGYARPMMTFLARMATGEYKSSSGDRYVMYQGFHPVSSVEKAMGSKDAARRIKDGAPRWSRGGRGMIQDFANTKLHPGVGLALELLEGRDFVGNDVNRAESLIRGILPIVPQNLADMWRTEDPDALAALSVLAVLGIGPRRDYDSPITVKAFSSTEEWEKRAFSVMRAGTKASATKTQRDRTLKYLAEMTPREVILITTKRGVKSGWRSETISDLEDNLLTMQAHEKARQKK